MDTYYAQETVYESDSPIEDIEAVEQYNDQQDAEQREQDYED